MKTARNRNALRRHAQPRRWSRLSRIEHLEARQLLAADMATSEYVSIRLEATDLSGVPITQVETGESFLIKAYIQDRRGQPGVTVPDHPQILDDPWGFYAAFINITYDMEGFDFDPNYPVTAGPDVVPVDDSFSSETTEDGFIGRIGLQDLVIGELQPQEIELFSFRMVAEQPGVYDALEGFQPHFHFEVPQRVYNPNSGTSDEIYYIDGVPQLERLTGTQQGEPFWNAVYGADEYISLGSFDGRLFTEDNEVFFQGVDLEVTSASVSEPEFEIRFVKNTTTPTSGEVNSLPSNLSYIDEWDTFFVEVYAQAPAGSNTDITSANVQLGFNPGDFEFVDAFGTSDDPALRYTVTYTEDQSETGSVTVGFTTLSTNTGDDKFALIGRIRLRSLMEVDNDTSSGYVYSVPSSEISLTEANATLRNKSTLAHTIVESTTGGSGYSFDVWPVMYDTDENEDRKVGLSDFSGFVSAFGLVADTPKGRKFDFDKNGVVGLSDFNLFVQNFGQNGTSLEGRIYNNQFPSGYETVPLMGSMSLEGEPIEESSTPTVYQSGPPQPVTDESSTETLSRTPLAYQPITTTDLPAEQGGSDELTVDAPTTAELVASEPLWTDQSELIWQAASTSDDSLGDDDSDDTFQEYADEVLALWDNEDNL